MKTALMGLVALFLAAGCSKAPAGTSPPATPPQAAAAPKTDGPPATCKVKFETSRGNFVVQVTRDWAPLGADRFHTLVKSGFYDDVRFFRVISGFMVQFGINGDPKVSAQWREQKIKDDPVKQSNTRGMITYAMGERTPATTQVFINFADNSRLDGSGFSPFGKVIEGMEVVDSLYAGYGEGAPRGSGPEQGRLQQEGNAYLNREFSKLDYVKTARIVD